MTGVVTVLPQTHGLSTTPMQGLWQCTHLIELRLYLQRERLSSRPSRLALPIRLAEASRVSFSRGS